MSVTASKHMSMTKGDIAKALENRGFLKDEANGDFNIVVDAIKEVCDGKCIGITFLGQAGCGKTTSAKAAARCIEYTHQYQDEDIDGFGGAWHKPFFKTVECFNCDDVASLRTDVLDDPMQYYFLDDVGMEQPVNEYGTRIDSINDFISRWWSVASNGRPKVLLLTTNLDADGLNARYGTRFVDRLLSATAIVKMSCASHRRRLTMGWSE